MDGQFGTVDSSEIREPTGINIKTSWKDTKEHKCFECIELKWKEPETQLHVYSGNTTISYTYMSKSLPRTGTLLELRMCSSTLLNWGLKKQIILFPVQLYAVKWRWHLLGGMNDSKPDPICPSAFFFYPQFTVLGTDVTSGRLSYDLTNSFYGVTIQPVPLPVSDGSFQAVTLSHCQ